MQIGLEEMQQRNWLHSCSSFYPPKESQCDNYLDVDIVAAAVDSNPASDLRCPSRQPNPTLQRHVVVLRVVGHSAAAAAAAAAAGTWERRGGHADHLRAQTLASRMSTYR